MPIQNASFNGVSFQVINVEDSFERALIEHAYPFVNGVDIEAMGLNAQAVRLSAVFLGEGYYADFKAFLKVLETNKPAVLVHPIRGRLPNMICVSSSFRHEAEWINYASVELQFKEATPAKPIFLFENSLLSSIDRALNRVDDFIQSAMDLYSAFMEGVVAVLNVKSKILGTWQAVFEVFEQVRDLFGFDEKQYRLSPSVSQAQFRAQCVNAAQALTSMLDLGLSAIALPHRIDINLTSRDKSSHAEYAVQFNQVFSARSRFDEMLRKVEQLRAIPQNLVVGRVRQPTAAEVAARLNNPQAETSAKQTAVSRLNPENMRELDCTLRLVCAATISKIAALLIEEQSEDMLPADIEYLCQQSRLALLDALNAVRALQLGEDANPRGNNPITGVYMQVQAVSENLRQTAHDLTQLALAAINQKPPLIVRSAPISGNIVQQAHEIYGDYLRAPEILRLNPHLRYPNCIEQGTVLNTYAN